jgi:glycosyltransferase involved in cell wall biosynthesis
MHIGYITSEYPHSRFDIPVGGIGTFTKTIAEALVKKGYRVSVIIHSQGKEVSFNENGVEIYHVKTYRIKGVTWLSNRFYFNRAINKIIKDQGVDLVEAPEWTGFTAGMQFKCPLVLRLHGSDTFFCDLEGRKVKFKNKVYEKLSLWGATKIVGVSAFVATRTINLFKLKSDIEVFYNGVDTSSLVPDHSKIEKGSVLYFGSIIRKKGVLELARAFNKVVDEQPDAKLYYLGRDVIDNLTGRSTLTLGKRDNDC